MRRLLFCLLSFLAATSVRFAHEAMGEAGVAALRCCNAQRISGCYAYRTVDYGISAVRTGEFTVVGGQGDTDGCAPQNGLYSVAVTVCGPTFVFVRVAQSAASQSNVANAN
jgi:hypothetical protein